MEPGHLHHVFNRAVAAMGMDVLRPSLYSLRHGGASEDLLRKRRNLAEVRRRGRWQTDTSLRRYSKETRLLSELSKIPSAILDYGRLIDMSIERIFAHGENVPPPPANP
eukprot:4077560-Karenia_brevis.AAC.1